MFCLFVALAGLPGRALEFGTLLQSAEGVDERASRIGLLDDLGKSCKKKGDWKCKFTQMRAQRDLSRANATKLKMERDSLSRTLASARHDHNEALWWCYDYCGRPREGA